MNGCHQRGVNGDQQRNGKSDVGSGPSPPRGRKEVRLKKSNPHHDERDQRFEDGSMKQTLRLAARRHVRRGGQRFTRHHQQQRGGSDQRKTRPPVGSDRWCIGRNLNRLVSRRFKQQHQHDQAPPSCMGHHPGLDEGCGFD